MVLEIIEPGQAAQQAQGIGMLRIGVQLLDRGFLDNIAAVHHEDAFRQAGDNPQVVGDPDDGHAQFHRAGA